MRGALFCALITLHQAAWATLSPQPARRLQVILDDGTAVTADTTSSYSDDMVRTLVLVADRSTRTGCPFNGSAKGLLRSGDRVFVSDYYLAWFDLTLDDGVSPPSGWQGASTYSRSGTIAGLWSLDPTAVPAIPFRHFYGSDDPSDGICWNWPRNELIPGSNSPSGGFYWWDKYAPPLEHDIVFSQTADSPPYPHNFFSATYSQGVPQGNFRITADGLQDGAGNLIYQTSSLLVSAGGDWTFANPAGQSGVVNSNITFACGERSIDVVWNFSPTVDASVNNLFVGAWLSYSAQSPTTCYAPPSPNYPLPTRSFGNWYQNVISSVLVSLSAPYQTATPGHTLSFDPAYTQPCQNTDGAPFNTDIDSPPPSAEGQPLPAGQWMISRVGPEKPAWKLTNLAAPGTGTGSASDPISFPFNRIVTSYESRDQTFGIYMIRGPYTDPSQWYTLAAGRWYTAHYSLSDADAPIDIGLRMTTGAGPFSAAAADMGMSPLWVNGATGVHSVLLVDPADRTASTVRVRTSDGVKAVKKL